MVRVLSGEQEAVAQEAGKLQERFESMTTTLRNNRLLEPQEEERLEDEVAEPLDEILEERLPRVTADIEGLPRSDRLREDVREIQVELKKMSSDLKSIATRLAGAGNMTEIIQKMELILELQRETIENTTKKATEE